MLSHLATRQGLPQQTWYDISIRELVSAGAPGVGLHRSVTEAFLPQVSSPCSPCVPVTNMVVCGWEERMGREAKLEGEHQSPEKHTGQE